MSQFLLYNKSKICKISEYQPNNCDKGKIWVDFYQSNNLEQVYESGVVEKSLLQPYLVTESNSKKNTDCEPITSQLQANCEPIVSQLQSNYNGFGNGLQYSPTPPNNGKTISYYLENYKELIDKLCNDEFIQKNSSYQKLELLPVTPCELAKNIGISETILRPVVFAAQLQKTKQNYEKKYIKKQYHIFYCFICILISFVIGSIIFGFGLINFDNEEIFVNQQTNLVEDKNFVLSLEKTIRTINNKPYTRFDEFVDSLAARQNKKIYDYSKDLIKKDFEKSNKNKSNLIAITNERLKAIKK